MIDATLLLPYCVLCGRKHVGLCDEGASVDVSRYEEVSLDTPAPQVLKVDFSKLTKSQVLKLYPVSNDPSKHCPQRSPDNAGWVCSRPAGHEGPHVGCFDHKPASGVGWCWNEGDSISVSPRNN